MLLDSRTADLSLIQHEVDALEELSRQLFLETVDLQATKVKIRKIIIEYNVIHILQMQRYSAWYRLYSSLHGSYVRF